MFEPEIRMRGEWVGVIQEFGNGGFSNDFKRYFIINPTRLVSANVLRMYQKLVVAILIKNGVVFYGSPIFIGILGWNKNQVRIIEIYPLNQSMGVRATFN